jgi:hypothetical protein
LVCFTVVLSCSDDDNSPTDRVPMISFDKLTFIKGKKDRDPDTLKLIIFFADGDMDLGLNGDDTAPPYHYRNYFLGDEKGDTTKVGTKSRYEDLPPFIHVKKDEKNDLITYRTRSKPGYTFLPPYEAPYICDNYQYDSIFVNEDDTAVFNLNEVNLDRVMKSNNKGLPPVYVLKDTFYFEVNPHARNMQVDIFTETSTGTFEIFKTPLNNYCNPFISFSNRFPRLESLTPGKTLGNGAYTATLRSRGRGEIAYKMVSMGLRPLFGGKRIKLRITIEDRALNRSNTIETEPLEIPAM